MATLTTLGEAYSANWGIRVRCQRGDHRGIVRIDPCQFEAALDMQSLVCTRGRGFPSAKSRRPYARWPTNLSDGKSSFGPMSDKRSSRR